MGYTNNVKKTPKGLRYRVWSTITDTYISGEMSEKELREFELVRQVRRSVQRIWQDMDRDVAETEKVTKWYRNTQKFGRLTNEQYEKIVE